MTKFLDMLRRVLPKRGDVTPLQPEQDGCRCLWVQGCPNTAVCHVYDDGLAAEFVPTCEKHKRAVLHYFVLLRQEELIRLNHILKIALTRRGLGSEKRALN